MGVRCGMLLRLPQRKLIWVTNWRTSLFQRSAIKLVRPFRMILGILYDVFSTLWKIHAVQGRIPNWQGSGTWHVSLLWSSRGKEASCRLHWLSDTWKVTIRTVHNCTCQGCTSTGLIPRLPPPWIMKARFLLVEFPIKTLILTLNPTELKDIRNYWTEPRVQSLIPWMSRPLTWMSMVWTCLNSLMVSILWSIPWSIHQPAMPRAMTSIDTPRRLVFWPHLSAKCPENQQV